MSFQWDSLKRLVGSQKSTNNIKPPASGLYHFKRQSGDEKTRLHLRVEENGTGILSVNASRILHLNSTGTFLAYWILQEAPLSLLASSLQKVYRIPSAQAQADLASFNHQLQNLIQPDGQCPVCDLQIEITEPFSHIPSAPYRMDLAITYRCNNNCAHCYNARPRNYPELSTEEWKKILNRVWEIGIPHVVFTGGEPTLRSDLPELIAHAEYLGLITGINTNGRRLADISFLDQLIQSGLDHVQITIESHDPSIHDALVLSHGAFGQTVQGIRNVLATRLFVMTNTTLLQENSPYTDQTLTFLAELGVPTVGLNALIYSGKGETVGTGLSESELPGLLELAKNHTQATGQRLIWYTPTEYCHFDPMQLDLGVKGCTAALYNMCIEPDGQVIPCQSYYQSLGHILDQTWQSIWEHPLAVSLRERRDVPFACHTCAIFQECGGGCPLARHARQNESIPIQSTLFS